MPRKSNDKVVDHPARAAEKEAEKLRLAAYKAWGGSLESQQQPDCNWGDVSSEYVYWLVKLVTSVGGNVTFGLTKDGTSFAVTVYFHPNRDPRYYSATEKGIEKFYADVREFAERLEAL